MCRILNVIILHKELIRLQKRLKELREYLGLTQKEFASTIGLKNGIISSYEKGDRNITQRNLILICEKFNVNKEWLLDGTGSMFKDVTLDTDFECFSEKTKNILRKIQELPESEQLAIQILIDSLHSKMKETN